MSAKFVVIGLALASGSAWADDSAWTASGGVDYRSSSFSLPGAQYKSHDWSVNATLIKALDASTSIGGVLSQNKSRSNYESTHLAANADSTSLGVFAYRQLMPGMVGDVYLGDGKSIVDYNTNSVGFSTGGTSTIVSAGVAQVIPFSPTLFASVGARLTRLHTKSDAYAIPLGSAVPEASRNLSFMTLSGRLDYVMGDLRPFVMLSWNKADNEFQVGSGDNAYFGYGAGISMTLSPKTSVAFTLKSVFDKAYADEMSGGLSLNHRF